MKGSKLKRYKRFELRMFWVHFNSVGPKVPHVLCHCYAAINIFIKIFKVLIFFLTCFRCNFVPFFLQTSLKVGNSTGSSLSHFALQNAPHILYWRQVGTAGRPVKYPYPLPPQPGLCNVCRMWFCIVLLKYAWTSLEKMSS